MLDEDLIRKWEDEGTIDRAQARKMEADLAEYRKEHRSKKQVLAFSTLGAVLIGLGAILFVAANWEKLPDFVKVLLLAGTTLGVHYTGYHLRYRKETYPKLGTSLIFLSSFLFGASVFLIAQIYNINANSHTLVLIWLLGVLPLVYGYRLVAGAGLCSLLFYVWMGLLYAETREFEQAIGIWDLFLGLGIALYLIGTLHELSKKTEYASGPYKLIGLQATLFFLLIHTFELHYDVGNLAPAIYALLGFGLLPVLLPKIVRAGLRGLPTTDNGILVLTGLLFGLALVSGHYPGHEKSIMIAFDIIYLAFLTLLLYTGYSKENMGTINTAILWFIPFLFARYFDLFWGLLPRSLFFIIGGLVLLGLSAVLERKRRELKARFEEEAA